MNGIRRAILLWRAGRLRIQALELLSLARKKHQRADELETRAGSRPKERNKGQNDGQPTRDRSR